MSYFMEPRVQRWGPSHADMRVRATQFISIQFKGALLAWTQGHTQTMWWTHMDKCNHLLVCQTPISPFVMSTQRQTYIRCSLFSSHCLWGCDPLIF